MDRLAKIEANAWRAYQDARRKAAAKPNAQTKLAAIDAGERWERRNADLHNFQRRNLAEIARKGRL